MNLDSVVKEAVEQSQDRLELWRHILTVFTTPDMCEVGVWKGEFAEYLLESVPDIQSYTLIDPWRQLPDWNKPLNKSNPEFDSVRDEALARVKPFEHKVRELRHTTKEAARYIEDKSLDFAYIDGDHTLRGITIDMHNILPKIRAGGFIGGDDFTKNIWQHDTSFSPTEVFPYVIYFAEAHEFKVYTLPFGQFLMSADASGFEVVDHAGYATLSPSEIYSKPSNFSLLAERLVPQKILRTIRKIVS